MRQSLALTRPRIWSEVLRPAAVALLIAAVTTGAAFGLQAATLRRATSSELLSVEAVRWLTRHRVVDGVTHVGGRRVTSTCVGGWVGPVRLVPRRTRASLLVTSLGQQLLSARGDIFRGNVRLQDDENARSLAAVALAGCPWWLGHRLGDVLQRHARLDVAKTVTEGQRTYRMRFGRAANRIDLYVDRATFAPVAINVAGRFGGWAKLRPGSLADIVRVLRFFTAVSSEEAS
jgi:hypothetical protein